MGGTMKIKSAVVLFILSFFVFAEAGQRTEWKGKIETENGIQIINNPKEPLYGEIVFDLEEDLVIGNEDDDRSYFYKYIYIDVDRAGNIYVLDTANNRVQKFDKSGNFVFTLGRYGQGPGEFSQQMSRLQIDGKGRICVLGNRQSHVFNPDGKWEKDLKFQRSIDLANFTETEKFIGKTSKNAQDMINEEIALFDLEGNQLKSYMNVSVPYFRSPDGSFVLSGRGVYSPRLQIIPWSTGSAVYGCPTEYKLFFLDSSGRMSHIVRTEKAPEPVTAKEKDEYLRSTYEAYNKLDSRFPKRKPLSMKEIEKAYPVPDTKPFFWQLFSDDSGNIYVMRPFSLGKKMLELDFFDKDGYYLYRIVMSLLPRIIKEGFVYDWHQHENGFMQIKRYRVKNWNNLKMDK